MKKNQITYNDFNSLSSGDCQEIAKMFFTYNILQEYRL